MSVSVLDPETDIMDQFLDPETDIMGERTFMKSSENPLKTLEFRDPRRRDGNFWPLDLAPVTEISGDPRLGLAPD